MCFVVEAVFGDRAMDVSPSTQQLPELLIRGRFWKTTRIPNDRNFWLLEFACGPGRLRCWNANIQQVVNGDIQFRAPG